MSINYLKHCLFILFVVITNNTVADTFHCPTIQEIKDRSISKEFDWTVSDKTSLDSVLNVNQLVSVTIENSGEFFRCSYKSGEELVNLDAKPITVDCLVVPSSQSWDSNQAGRSVCNDGVKDRCEIAVSCQIIQDGS